jgi:hypothetical protein
MRPRIVWKSESGVRYVCPSGRRLRLADGTEVAASELVPGQRVYPFSLSTTWVQVATVISQDMVHGVRVEEFSSRFRAARQRLVTAEGSLAAFIQWADSFMKESWPDQDRAGRLERWHDLLEAECARFSPYHPADVEWRW